MCITDNLIYMCTQNYKGGDDLIGIATNTEKAKEIITAYHDKCLETEISELNWIGKDGVYCCDVISKYNRKILIKRFAEINPVELNERLF